MAPNGTPIRETALAAFATVKGNFDDWKYAVFRADTNDHEAQTVCRSRSIEVAETFDQLASHITWATQEQQVIIFAKLDGFKLSYNDCLNALDGAHPPLSIWLYNLMAKLANIEQKLEIAQLLILPTIPALRDLKAATIKQLAMDKTLDFDTWWEAYKGVHNLNTALKDLAWTKAQELRSEQQVIAAA